jgi:hypothetical protein
MDDLKRLHAKDDVIERQRREISRLRLELSSIADSEMIPTPAKAYMWCVGVAKAALADQLETAE